jgi:hypothetical protein
MGKLPLSGNKTSSSTIGGLKRRSTISTGYRHPRAADFEEQEQERELLVPVLLDKKAEAVR